MRCRDLYPFRRRFEAPERQPSSEGHYFRERNGDRRPGAPSSEALRVGSEEYGLVCRLSGRGDARGGDDIRCKDDPDPRRGCLGRAEVRNIDALSAHADADETIEWLKSAGAAPRRTFVTHGEPRAARALQTRIAKELGWTCIVPERTQEARLNEAVIPQASS